MTTKTKVVLIPAGRSPAYHGVPRFSVRIREYNPGKGDYNNGIVIRFEKPELTGEQLEKVLRETIGRMP